MAAPVATTWLRRLAWAAAAVLVLWLLAWLAVPPLLKAQAQQRLTQALGRPVTVGAVALRPWSLELTFTDVAIGAGAAAGAQAPPLLEVARLHANGDWRSLLRLAPVLSRLQIERPRLHVSRTAPGRYDIDDLIDRFSRPAATPAADDSDDGPARFAVYNVELRDGAIVFDDRPVQRRHELAELQLALPFLSSLPSQVEVVVQPRLSFRLGDTRFDTGAQSTPFAPDRQTQMTLRMSELDLAPLTPYLPADLPVQLQRGRAKAEASLRFERREDGASTLSLGGVLEAMDMAWADRAGTPLAAWKALRVQVADAQPLARTVALDTVRFEGLDVAVARDANGVLNLARLRGPPAQAAASAQASASASASSAPAGKAWTVTLQALELAGARVSWTDAATEPAAALALEAIDAHAGPAAWPSQRPAPLKLQARLVDVATAGKAAAQAAMLKVEGEAGAERAQVTVRVGGLALATVAPYLRTVLRPRLEGTGAVEATVSWEAQPHALSLDVARLALDDLRLDDGSLRPAREAAGRDATARDPLSWKALEVTGARVDLVSRHADVGRVALKQPRVALERAQDGSLNAAGWRVADPAPDDASGAASGGAPDAQAGSAPAATPGAPSRDAAPRATASAAPPPSSLPPWRVTLAAASIEDGRLRWSDDAAGGATDATPARLNVSALNASATGLTWPQAARPADLRLSAVVADPAAPRGSRRQQGGRVEWLGRITPQPLALAGALQLERFPLHALEPYFGGGFNASLQRAEGHWRGDVALRQAAGGIEATAAGDALLSDVHVYALDRGTGAVSPEELLSWRSFQLRGLKVAVAPGAKPAVDIGEAIVSDFYSQLVVTEEGRFNLRDVRTARTGDPSPPGGFAVGRQIAPPEAASAASAPAPAASAAPGDAPAAGLPLDLRLGGLQLVNGRVDYTDRFVRPNYSAALSELNGRLGAFQSGSPEMATLELDGRVAGTARLEIRGSLNPTADPLALDVRAKATDLELAPLSPYAGKYAGYAIERGKLSMDVHYRVQPDGRLEASNRVVLNQLTFGERIESPDATKLPVRLAVALLKDRNGVIDVNLPVSGSLNDPQFSVAGVVLRIIGNLIAKALTAPFSLLAGGGGDDLGVVAFSPGAATLDDAAAAAVDKVAQALRDRPALQMTVTGGADAEREADAMRRQQLERRIAAQRRSDAVRAGRGAPDGPLAPDERERLLRAIYRDAELPDKPRNVLGFEKDLPAAEMEALLLRHTRVGPDAARELALQRGVAVRDALVTRGLPSERLFLAAPKLGEEPRAVLALSVK